MSPPRFVGAPGAATIAAHFLTTAGSELHRAGALLDDAGWTDEDTARRLREVVQLVGWIRMAVDAAIDHARAVHRQDDAGADKAAHTYAGAREGLEQLAGDVELGR